MAEGVEARDTTYDITTKERQLREQNHGIKKEHDIRFLEGEEHLHFEGDVCEDWMETITSLKHLQHLQQHL
jgi:hypothetical protein